MLCYELLRGWRRHRCTPLPILELTALLLVGGHQPIVVLLGQEDAVLVAIRRQVAPQSLDLFRVLLDECALRQLLVDFRFVGDALGAVRVLQRADRLLEVARRRRDGGDDGRFGAAAQRVLQQPRQLALPETAIVALMRLLKAFTSTNSLLYSRSVAL